MAREEFYLCSFAPFDFKGYCTCCHQRTDRMIAVDVSQRNLPLAVAGLVVPAVALMSLKSVRIPHCQSCRGWLWSLRLVSAILAILLSVSLAYEASGTNRGLKNSDSGMYLFVGCVFGLVLIPFLYTALKEYFLGANVFFQKGIFYYRFRNARVPEFLEIQGLCKRSGDNSKFWLAVE